MTSAADVVFLGPSIAKGRVPKVPFEIRPPVQQGDVLRARARGAKRIGIIDGYFDQVPSVWHKEILLAIEEGAIVYGAASMGALRAAELHAFGVIGVGRVFEMYRDGILEDDDEVALLHASADADHRAISEALVNLRDLLDTAVTKNVITGEEKAAAIARLKDLPYPLRSIRKLVEILPKLGGFVKEPHTSLKERDAVALLERMKRDADAPLPVEKRVRVERTVFLERLRHEVTRDITPTLDRGGAREELLALLAVDHAVSMGATPTREEIDDVVREWMTENGLASDEDLVRFSETRQLDLEVLVVRAREEASVRRLESLYGGSIAARIAEATKLAR
jgi:hypothetical protein